MYIYTSVDVLIVHIYIIKDVNITYICIYLYTFCIYVYNYISIICEYLRYIYIYIYKYHMSIL